MKQKDLTDEDVFGKAAKSRGFTDEEVFGPRDDLADTARIAGGDLAQGMREGANPLGIFESVIKLGQAALPYTNPLNVQAQKGIGADKLLTDVADWLTRNKKYTDPAEMLPGAEAANPLMAGAVKSLYGAPSEDVLQGGKKVADTIGADYTPLRADIGAGARFAGAMLGQGPLAIMGGPLPYVARSLAGATLSGAGHAAAGEGGALVGGVLGSGLPMRSVAPPPAPSTRSFLKQGGAALDDFAATPGAVTPQSFQKYAAAVEAEINPYKRTSTLYGEYPLPPSTYPHAAPLMEKMRTWAKGQTQDGRPIYGFTMDELNAFRTEINGALTAAAHRSPDQRALLAMKHQLDGYVGGLRNKTDALHGNVESAAAALKEGNSLYSRGMAARMADEMAKRAENRSASYVLSNADRATRTEFGKAINNPRTLSRLEATQPGITEIITEAGQGGTLRNIEAFAGRYSPHAVVPAMGHAGAMLSGRGGAVPVVSAIVTAIARMMANSRARKDAAGVSDFIRRGGPAPRESAPNGAFIGAILDAIRAQATEGER